MEKFKPDIYQEKITDVPFSSLKKEGIKIILLDLDNTILRYKEKEIDKDIKDYLNKLKKDFKVILFSNAMPAKVKKMASLLDIPYMAFACKPKKRKFKKILLKYKVEAEEVAVVGDQILTDIKGGNIMNMATVLVKPLSKKENILTKPNRLREAKIIRKMSDRGVFFKERYYE